LVPIFSVISIGTRQPFKKMLRRLNQPIISTSLRVIASPWRLRRSWRVESVRVTDLLSADTQVNQPLLDLRADYVGMILLQIMNARGKLDNSAVCKTLRKAPAECWRDERARISHEKQFWIGRFG